MINIDDMQLIYLDETDFDPIHFNELAKSQKIQMFNKCSKFERK